MHSLSGRGCPLLVFFFFGVGVGGNNRRGGVRVGYGLMNCDYRISDGFVVLGRRVVVVSSVNRFVCCGVGREGETFMRNVHEKRS